ncbi:MAG: MGH1-like glycoside hydrolase domain-containing protein [Chthoniobacterales bacterium]
MDKHPELLRMKERDERLNDWGLWGSYLSDRQWGTVREDYSANGDAWAYFPFDHAHARVYRWGEDGLLGICDNDNRLCFAPTFWNGKDPILKERPFGLSNPQGNHGEDVKDYFYHLENTPSYSFMRGLYKYPQAAFPYQQLIEENKKRSREESEYELVDTGIFNEGRYFDIFVEYAKEDIDDLCIRIRSINRGPDPSPLFVLPTLWFRNVWSWGQKDVVKPTFYLDGKSIVAQPWGLEEYRFIYDEEPAEILFTENETNNEKIFKSKNAAPYLKDAFHDYLIKNQKEAVNPEQKGTKVAPVYYKVLAPGEEWTVQLRLCTTKHFEKRPSSEYFDVSFDITMKAREEECISYYRMLHPNLNEELFLIQRRALAGLIWCKKFYYYPVISWLRGDPTMPKPPVARWKSGNAFWKEMHAHDIISMPDSWEYPYFCSWDLMFHAVAFAVVDPAIAKRQNILLRGERYTAPNAQAPSYEWSLSDSTPPIDAWATWRIYSIERARTGVGDHAYLRKAFNKLLLTYAWWGNRVDATGENVFAGGFLGLDNVSVFDRRYNLDDGSKIMQSDGTAWMSMFALNMLNIAIELAKQDPEYEHIADKFLSDFVYLAAATNDIGTEGYSLWNEEDGFYYDVIKRPNGSSEHLKVRSIVGLTPLFAVESFDSSTVKRFSTLLRRFDWFRHHRPELMVELKHLEETNNERKLISLVPPDRLARLLKRLFDEQEFLSPHGIRSLSRYYQDHPYTFTEGTDSGTINYTPAESSTGMFGGNSNWRGPIWMPMNMLIIESLQKFAFYYGDSFKVEFPTGSGVLMNLWEISLQLERRLITIFTKDKDGNRPFNGNVELFQKDPYWCDHICFNEYFHGDTAAGLGASHQTGWTAIIAKMIQQAGSYGKM